LLFANSILIIKGEPRQKPTNRFTRRKGYESPFSSTVHHKSKLKNRILITYPRRLQRIHKPKFLFTNKCTFY